MPMLCGGGGGVWWQDRPLRVGGSSPKRREELDGRDGHGPSCPGGMVEG